MDVKKTIEEMVRDIIQSIRAEEISKPKVLFIFCDSQAHEPYLDQLIKIQNNGISHDVLFLDGETSAWLGIQRIECAGAGKIIATDEYAPAPYQRLFRRHIQKMKELGIEFKPQQNLADAVIQKINIKKQIESSKAFTSK